MSTPTDAYVLRPTGTISTTTAAEFRQELIEVVDAGNLHVQIDLADIDMIDSTGLSVFVQCYQTLVSKGGSLTVVTDDKNLLGLFRLMNLDQHFVIRGREAA